MTALSSTWGFVAESTDRAMRPKRLRSIAEVQCAVADQHPQEFVVMKGRDVLGTTSDEEEAFALWKHAWSDGKPGEPIVIPPLAERIVMRQRRLGRGAEPARRR